jgi:hypothetical protein
LESWERWLGSGVKKMGKSINCQLLFRVFVCDRVVGRAQVKSDNASKRRETKFLFQDPRSMKQAGGWKMWVWRESSPIKHFTKRTLNKMVLNESGSHLMELVVTQIFSQCGCRTGPASPIWRCLWCAVSWMFYGEHWSWRDLSQEEACR